MLLEGGNGLRGGNRDEENDAVNAGCGGEFDSLTLSDCQPTVGTVETVETDKAVTVELKTVKTDKTYKSVKAVKTDFLTARQSDCSTVDIPSLPDGHLRPPDHRHLPHLPLHEHQGNLGDWGLAVGNGRLW